MGDVAAAERPPSRLAPDVDLEVDVRRSTRVVARVDRFEGREALLVRELDPAQVGLARGPVRCLVRIEAARVAVPDVDGGAVDRAALLDVDHPDLERQRNARPAPGHVPADSVEGDVEGPLGDLRSQLAGPCGHRRGDLVGPAQLGDRLSGDAAERERGPCDPGHAEGLPTGEAPPGWLSLIGHHCNRHIRDRKVTVSTPLLALLLLAVLLLMLLRRGGTVLLVVPALLALLLLQGCRRRGGAGGCGRRSGADDPVDRIAVRHVQPAARVLTEGPGAVQVVRGALGTIPARERNPELDGTQLAGAEIRIEVAAGELGDLGAAVDVAAHDRAA